jgi:hypothetical protein
MVQTADIFQTSPLSLHTGTAEMQKRRDTLATPKLANTSATASPCDLGNLRVAIPQ